MNKPEHLFHCDSRKDRSAHEPGCVNLATVVYVRPSDPKADLAIFRHGYRLRLCQQHADALRDDLLPRVGEKSRPDIRARFVPIGSAES